MKIKTIGFLGMGIMGKPMARNLLNNGFELVVWNRDAAQCKTMVDAGAVAELSPARVVAAADVTFAMLADPSAAENVCFGPNGVLETMQEGKSYVDFSTVDDFTSKNIAEAIIECGGRYLEAPVSGSKSPAENGQLIILAGGDRSLFDELEQPFRALSKKTIYLGEVGQAARMKLVINMIMGGMMGVFCEGLALGEKCSLKTNEILDILSFGALANSMFASKGAQIMAKDFSPAFPLKHLQKDMRLAVELGEESGQCLNISESVLETFSAAVASGLGDEDFCAVGKSLCE